MIAYQARQRTVAGFGCDSSWHGFLLVWISKGWHCSMYFSHRWQRERWRCYTQQIWFMGWVVPCCQWLLWVILENRWWVGSLQGKMLWVWEGNHTLGGVTLTVSHHIDRYYDLNWHYVANCIFLHLGKSVVIGCHVWH